MSQQDLIRTIQIQQGQINQLREQLSHNQNTAFELKYKKALNQISEMVKANRQLKEELVRLSNFKSVQNDNFNKINKDELGKAYDKLLKEKNELLGQKEALLLENQNLKRSVNNLQDVVTKLKNDKMSLAREKEGASKLNYLQKSPQGGSSEKLRQKDVNYYKQKESQMRKTLQNYEQRHSSLSRTNRKLEQQISQLENKIFKIQDQYKNRLNEKDIQLKISKSAARQQYQSQIAALKKQISQLKIGNNQLSMKVNTLSQEDRNYRGDPSNEYEEQLIQTLRQLKSQMEPMTAQIAELQEKGQFDKQQLQREYANLQIKVMEYESEIERLKQNQKILQQRILKESDKTRKWQDSEKNLRKLEEENRMLGGRVIVLEAKEVALRNRSGDELEERVLQFQTRVEMLLNDKQTIANLKNVGIHQLIALKAYILELDGKLKQVVNENEYAVKKYKSYKQKCTHLIRELKQHDIAINALKGKLQGYDRLVVKLQGELQRAITINDNQMKAINVKISESTMNSIDVYRKKYESLIQKLELQEKYKSQEIQTLKLNYDTKLLDLNLKLEQLSSVRDTIGLYKSKNQQLSNKLTQRENELLQTKMTKIVITDSLPQSKNPHKETINKLNETIHSKEGMIINLENQLRKIEQEWKGKYSQLEQSNNAAISKKNREEQEKKREIESLQNQIKAYRNKINQLQSKSSPVVSRVIDDDFKKIHHISGKVSDLEVEIEDWKNKYEIEVAKITKLNKANTDLKQTNGDLEGEVSRLKFQLKRIEKQMQMELEDKNNEIKRIQINMKGEGESRVIRTDSDNNNFKVNSLKMELQLLQSQAEQLQRDKTRYYNRTIELQRQLSQLSMKIQQLNYGLQRAKNNVNNDLILQQTEKQQQIERLNYNLKSWRDKNADLQVRIGEYQQQISKLRNQLARQRQRLATELDHKDEQLSKAMRELNRIRNDVTNQDDIRDGIKQEYQFKFNRMQTDNISLRDQIQSYQNQIQRFENQIRFLRNRQIQFNSKAEGQQSYLQKISSDLRNFQNKQVELESALMDKESKISQLTNELYRVRAEINDIEQAIKNKDSALARLTTEVNTYRNNQIELQIQLGNRQGEVNKLNSEVIYARNRVADLQNQLQFVQTQVRKLRSQSTQNEQSYSHISTQIQQKQMIILRLKTDVRSRTEQLNQLASQIEGKNQKISEIQSQFGRYRSMSSGFESEVMEKNQQISKLTYELNALKLRYENLQQQHENKEGNWSTLNRQLASIRVQIGNYEDDLSMKDAAIERYKGDIRQLSQQIQKLNEQIFEKNSSINKLNQELFRVKLSGEEQSSQQVYKLENQIYQLKSRVSSLQGELDLKQGELSRARLQISQVRSNVSVTKYTDDEYELLQTQYYQSQRSLTEVRSQISEKDLEITQLQGKIEYMRKLEADAKRRFSQERNDLETQLQNVLARERELRNKVTNLQGDVYLTNNRANDEKQFGMLLYQQECDRLTKITQELQQEVSGLKLKLTYFTNQQDRIIQNLTVMTLTFAQVQALRQRMKTKQSQISEVRKSLINFATSSEDITSMSSRVLVKQRQRTEQSNRDNQSRQQSRDNLELPSYTSTVNKRAETVTYSQSNEPVYYNYTSAQSTGNQYGRGEYSYTQTTNQYNQPGRDATYSNTNTGANQYSRGATEYSSFQPSASTNQYKSGDYTNTYMSEGYKLKSSNENLNKKQAQRKMQNLQQVSSKYSSLRQSDYDDYSVPQGGYNYQLHGIDTENKYRQDGQTFQTKQYGQYAQYGQQNREGGVISSPYAVSYKQQPYSSNYTDMQSEVIHRGVGAVTKIGQLESETPKDGTRTGYNYEENDFNQQRYEGNPDEDEYQQINIDKTADRRLNELANSITGGQIKSTSQAYLDPKESGGAVETNSGIMLHSKTRVLELNPNKQSEPNNSQAQSFHSGQQAQGLQQPAQSVSVQSNQQSGQLQNSNPNAEKTSQIGDPFLSHLKSVTLTGLVGRPELQALSLPLPQAQAKLQALSQAQAQAQGQAQGQSQGQIQGQSLVGSQTGSQVSGQMLVSQTQVIMPNTANYSVQQSYPPAQTSFQPPPQPSLATSLNNPPAWRFGATGSATQSISSGSQSMSGQNLQQHTPIQTQPLPQVGLQYSGQQIGQQHMGQLPHGQLGQAQFVQQRTSQQQVKVQFGSSGNIGSSKALSPPPGAYNQGQVQMGAPQPQLQIQGRQFGQLPPQNVQYPGFAR